eukprot:286459-Hanusia_phi.AAC.1
MGMLVDVEGAEEIGGEGSQDPGKGLVLDKKEKIVVRAGKVLLLLLEEVCGLLVAAMDNSRH